MSIKHTVSVTWGSGSDLIGAPVTLTGTLGEQNYELALGVVTNQLVDLAWAQAKLELIYIVADQPCTLKLNSSGSPTDTITLAANEPLCWYKGCGLPYPFVGTSGAVTAGYFTTTVATNIEVRTLLDL